MWIRHGIIIYNWLTACLGKTLSRYASIIGEYVNNCSFTRSCVGRVIFQSFIMRSTRLLHNLRKQQNSQKKHLNIVFRVLQTIMSKWSTKRHCDKFLTTDATYVTTDMLWSQYGHQQCDVIMIKSKMVTPRLKLLSTFQRLNDFHRWLNKVQ